MAKLKRVPTLSLTRVGKHGKVFLTVPSLSSTAEEKFIKKGGLSEDDSLLDLAPEDTVFYVGGVPANFKVSYGTGWLGANLQWLLSKCIKPRSLGGGGAGGGVGNNFKSSVQWVLEFWTRISI